MDSITVISFDAESTLVTPRFSQAVWHEGIPALYAEERGIGFEEAKALVQQEYQQVGEHKIEWYDITYWFRRLGLTDHQRLLNSHRHEISCYPEVEEVLSSLGTRYKLIVASGSAREFLDILLEGIKHHFVSLFSSISDFRELKSPSFYLKVCQALGIKPQEMAHVGDRLDFDVTIPRQVGVESFHLDREGEKTGDGVVTDLREFERKFLGA